MFSARVSLRAREVVHGVDGPGAQRLAVLQRGVLVSHVRKAQPQGPRRSRACYAAPQAPVLQHRHVRD